MKLVRPSISLCKSVLDFQLGTGINGRGCLVQNQHRRAAQHHTGDAQQLFLSLGKTAAVLGDHGVIALWADA